MKKTAVKSKTKSKKPAAKKTVKKTAKKAAAKKPTKAKAALRIIGKGEKPPVRIENLTGKGRAVVVCDHASNRVPKSLKNLGLGKKDLAKHIAWDPGTEVIGKYLSKALDAPAVYAQYSRLVVDLNRGEDNKECMRDESDHIRIPRNVGLTDAEREQRLNEIFWPYHAAIDKAVTRFTGKGIIPMFLSIHSFTPKMDGFKRPWEIGILWNHEEKLARQLAKNLRAQNPGMTVGENEPYSLKSVNYSKNTISTHAEGRGLPYIIVEFRQDLVGDRKGALKWGKIFLKALQPILDDKATYTQRKPRRK